MPPKKEQENDATTGTQPAEASTSSSSSTSQPTEPASEMAALVNAMTAAFQQSAGPASDLRQSTIRPPRPYALGQNFKTWLAQYSAYLELVRIPTGKQRALLLNNLDQQAYRAVELLRIPEDASYGEFVERIKERFDSGKTKSDYKLLLRSRSQNQNQDFEMFADFLLELAENAYPDAEYTFKAELARDRFLEGISWSDNMREQLFVQQPATLTEAVRMVRQLQSAHMASRGTKSSQKTGQHCNTVNVGQPSTEMKDLKDILAQISSRLDVLESHATTRPVNRATGGRGRNPKNVRWHSCQGRGHYALDYPQNHAGNDKRGLARGGQTL